MDVCIEKKYHQMLSLAHKIIVKERRGSEVKKAKIKKMCMHTHVMRQTASPSNHPSN